MRKPLIVCTTAAVIGAVLVTAGHEPAASAHCQVPCGIYDDPARIQLMLEDATTISKAMHQINDLADRKDAQSLNQAVRWVHTKEEHASRIITTVAEYFLTQKVKPLEPGADGYQTYLESLADHHRVMVAAMKTKQTVDPANAERLAADIRTLGKHYGQ